MITQHQWMFLSSFEKLRIKLINTDIVNMAHLGPRGFDEIGGEVVQTTAFIFRKTKIKTYQGTYSRLITGMSETEKAKIFLQKQHLFITNQDDFKHIPGSPYAYWISKEVLDAFGKKKISDIGSAKVGIGTGNTDLFLKMWQEVDFGKINFNRGNNEIDNIIFAPINKGGSFRKWYGNFDYVINWKDNGRKIKEYRDKNGNKASYPRNLDAQLKESLTWGDISTSMFSLRYSPEGSFFSDVGNSLFVSDKELLMYVLAYGNSAVFNSLTGIINQTMHFKPGNMMQMPLIVDETVRPEVSSLSKQNIDITKNDWDSLETSWGFKHHPLVPLAREKRDQEMSQFATSRMEKFGLLSWHYKNWEAESQDRFEHLKENEEKINRIFINIYGLRDELTSDVKEKDVTVRKADLQRDIKSLLSYAVGSMFGRYSLDAEGLIYAGGEWDVSQYLTFIPDMDNVIPITDEEYLEDDIVSRLCTWLKVVYGESKLEENLDFIAKALGNKGSSSREIIRNYFLNDFFKDHCQTYSVTGSGKRPIYWLFDSGKQNGFRALIYLHRYDADTIGNLRIDYLHRMQRIYESEIGRMQDMIDHSTNAREVGQATKRRDKLTKQLKECREYDEKLAHLALSRIELDLDDGVKINYRKLQTANDGKFYEVLADSKNIMANDKLWKQYLERRPE